MKRTVDAFPLDDNAAALSAILDTLMSGVRLDTLELRDSTGRTFETVAIEEETLSDGSIVRNLVFR